MLADSGVREINLIAQDLTAYGRDLSPRASLAALLERLAGLDGIRWIRLLYCYPNFVTDELLAAIAGLDKVVKYIDIPLQHADDAILRMMKRERSADGLRRLLGRIRAAIPGVAIRTSFIVGFPGETDEAFANLLSFVREQRFDRVGVFTYSREENTAAFEYSDQLPVKLKRRRRAELMEAAAEISLEKNQEMLGREVEVFIEDASQGRIRRLRARTAVQAPEIDGFVMLDGEADPGEFVTAHIERVSTYDLFGRVTNPAVRHEAASHA